MKKLYLLILIGAFMLAAFAETFTVPQNLRIGQGLTLNNQTIAEWADVTNYFALLIDGTNNLQNSFVLRGEEGANTEFRFDWSSGTVSGVGFVARLSGFAGLADGLTNASPAIATNSGAADGMVLSKTGDRLKWVAAGTSGTTSTNLLGGTGILVTEDGGTNTISVKSANYAGIIATNLTLNNATSTEQVLTNATFEGSAGFATDSSASFVGGSAQFTSGGYAYFANNSYAAFLNGSHQRFSSNASIRFLDGSSVLIGGMTNTGTSVLFTGDGFGLTNASPNIATNGGASDGMVLSKTGDRVKWVAAGGGGGFTNMMVSTITHGAAITPALAIAGLVTDNVRRITFRLTMTADVTTVNAPSGTAVDGDQMTWEVIQDGTGGWTIGGWDAAYVFGTDITGITLSTAASKRDFITFVYNSAGGGKWYCVGYVRGF